MSQPDHSGASPQEHCCSCCKREDEERRIDTLVNAAVGIISEVPPGQSLREEAEAYLKRMFSEARTPISSLPKL